MAKEHKVMIVVNGRAVIVQRNELSFAEVIELSGIQPADIGLTVTYRGEAGVSGTMVYGDVLKIQDGMIFNVADTSRA